MKSILCLLVVVAVAQVSWIGISWFFWWIILDRSSRRIKDCWVIIVSLGRDWLDEVQAKRCKTSSKRFQFTKLEDCWWPRSPKTSIPMASSFIDWNTNGWLLLWWFSHFQKLGHDSCPLHGRVKIFYNFNTW